MIQAEGVILSKINYRDYDQILTVYTPEHGMIKLVAKMARMGKKGVLLSVEPLTFVEISYIEGRGDLFKCTEVSVLNRYLNLRASLLLLEAACDMLNALLISQMPGKRSPALYELLKKYLSHFSDMKDPWVLAASFRLKVLKAEGLLLLPSGKEEEDLKNKLANCRKFSEIQEISLPQGFMCFIRREFEKCIV